MQQQKSMNLHADELWVTLDTDMLNPSLKSISQSQNQTSVLSNIICRNTHTFTQPKYLAKTQVQKHDWTACIYMIQ